MSEQQPQTEVRRRPKRHWKHCRFIPTDTFLWAKDTIFAGKPVAMGSEVDKASMDRGKLLRLFRARLIQPKWDPPVVKDPQAPPLYPAEDVETVAAA